MPIDRFTGQRITVGAHIEECIDNILSTPLRSRPMDPTYGADLYALADINLDPVGLATIRAGTAGAITTLETRPQYERVATVPNAEGRVDVTVHWSVDGTSSETTVSL